MAIWRWSSFAQEPATRFPLLSFILVIGALLLISLLAIAPADPPAGGKEQRNAKTLGEMSLFGRHPAAR
jgi:hypothetical protein